MYHNTIICSARYNNTPVSGINTAIAAGWLDPESGLVLPLTPRLAPAVPRLVWYLLRQECIAKEDMAAMQAVLIDLHGVCGIQLYSPTRRQADTR
jgi:hypothetical protein